MQMLERAEIEIGDQTMVVRAFVREIQRTSGLHTPFARRQKKKGKARQKRLGLDGLKSIEFEQRCGGYLGEGIKGDNC